MSEDSIPLPKRCRTCQQEHPNTTEYFRMARKSLRTKCILCERKDAIQWAQEHPEQRKKMFKEWAKQNPQNQRDRASKYAHNHPDKVRKQQSKWRQGHPSATKGYAQRYNAKKRGLPHTFTEQDWDRCLIYWNYCCAYCGKQRGLFKYQTIDADHWIPMNSENCPGTVPLNIIPACHSCNTSKSDRDPFEWLTWKFGKRKCKQIAKCVSDYFDQI